MDIESPSTPPGPVSEPAIAADPSLKIDMVFRFWVPGLSDTKDRHAQSASAQHPGVLALIEDAAAAKRGVLVASDGQVVVSGFREPADALVVSRQIQHGMQGFRGKAGTAPVAVSIVIDFRSRASRTQITELNLAAERQGSGRSSSDKKRSAHEISHELTTLLAIAKPAQVLVTHDLLQQIAAIKGLALKSFPGRFGVYEYLWTGEDRLNLLQSEPQLTLTAFTPAPAAPAGAKEQKETTSQLNTADVPKEVSDKPERVAKIKWPWPEVMQLPRPLLLGGIAVAAILLISIISFALFRGHPSAPAPGNTPAQVTAPIPTPANGNSPSQLPASRSTSGAPAPTKSTTMKAPSSAAKNARQKPAVQPPVAEAAKPAESPTPPPCRLTGDIGQYARLAESNREQGDYRDAVRIFRQVLDCDPNNAQAREGLNRAMQAEQQNK